MGVRRTTGDKRHASQSTKPTKLIFIVGGARSGKSRFALKICSKKTSRVFLATADALDEEMQKRIHAHQKARGKSWETIEIPIHVAQWFCRRGSQYSAVVVDCLTLWLNNLLRDGVRTRQIPSRIKEFLRAVQVVPGQVVVVSNELGLGLVPGDANSRKFRDLAGRMNQLIAAESDEVYFVVSGIPLRLKSSE